MKILLNPLCYTLSILVQQLAKNFEERTAFFMNRVVTWCYSFLRDISRHGLVALHTIQTKYLALPFFVAFSIKTLLNNDLYSTNINKA
jgi:hypothetical protein